MRAILVLLVCLFVLSGPVFGKDAEIAGRATVIDGDTIQIRDRRVRLLGIDAPESSQLCSADGKQYHCGQKAARFLDSLLLGKSVSCRVVNVDRYGRSVGQCVSGETDINEWMVRNGWALAYRDYSKDYILAENEARLARVGIWTGEFEKPWDYRRKPTTEEIGQSEGCLIKGNINRKGRKIFHLPGTPAYGRTKINKQNGERWFCSEREAIKAGWVSAYD